MYRSIEQGTQHLRVVLRFVIFIIVIIITANTAYLGRWGEWSGMGPIGKGVSEQKMQHLSGLHRGLWIFRAGEERNKVDRFALDCQEKAYWLMHRCPVSTTLLVHPPLVTLPSPPVFPTPCGSAVWGWS